MCGKAPEQGIENQHIDERVDSTHQAVAEELLECAAPCMETMERRLLSDLKCLSRFLFFLLFSLTITKSPRLIVPSPCLRVLLCSYSFLSASRIISDTEDRQGNFRQCKGGTSDQIPTFPARIKFLFKWEERLVGSNRCRRSVTKLDAVFRQDRSYLLPAYRTRPPGPKLRTFAPRRENARGPVRVSVPPLQAEFPRPACEIERPSPCFDLRVVACRFVSHTPIDGGKGHKCACVPALVMATRSQSAGLCSLRRSKAERAWSIVDLRLFSHLGPVLQAVPRYNRSLLHAC